MIRTAIYVVVMTSALSTSACSDDSSTAARPVAPPGPSTATDGGADALPATDAGGPPGECATFATENEQLLNAPTSSVPIKKKAVLPP